MLLLRCTAQNIVLSGGNTLFRKLASRMQKSIDERVQGRLKANRARMGAHVAVRAARAVYVEARQLG